MRLPSRPRYNALKRVVHGTGAVYFIRIQDGERSSLTPQSETVSAEVVLPPSRRPCSKALILVEILPRVFRLLFFCVLPKVGQLNCAHTCVRVAGCALCCLRKHRLRAHVVATMPENRLAVMAAAAAAAGWLAQPVSGQGYYAVNRGGLANAA